MRQSLSPRDRGRRRRKVGAAVRAITPEPHRKVHASRRAFLELYWPRLTLTPWKDAAGWRVNRPKILAGIIVVVLLIALVELFNAPIFFVEGVTWRGNQYVGADELSQTLAVQGWSIFFLDPRELETRLLSRPEVQGAHVSLALPNSVNVELIERTPRFVWETNGATYWVDQNGIAFAVRANLSGLMWLRDLDGKPVKQGARINAEAFNAAVSLHNVWPDGPMTFEWSDVRGLATREQHGWLVYFGRAQQMAEKLTALQIVSAEIAKENKSINFIDLGSGLPYYQEVAAPVTKKQ